MRWSRYWLLLTLLLLFAAALAAFLPGGETPLADSIDSWKFGGNVGVPPMGAGSVFAEGTDPLYFVIQRPRGGGRAAGDGSGGIESPPFTAPAWIGLTVLGDLTRPGNDVYFRRVDGNGRLPVRVNTGFYFWRRVTLRLPFDWVGRQIQLVADGGPRQVGGDFGVSSPRALSTGTVFRSQFRALAVLPAFLVALAFFLLPGLPLAVRLVARGRLSPGGTVPVAIVFSCTAGYLTFWAYFLHPLFGHVFAGLVLSCSGAVLVADLWKGGAARALVLSDDVRLPLALTALVGLFYLSLVYSVDLDVRTGGEVRVRFLDFPLAIDNELPYYFADRLYHRQDPRELIGDWHSSDRPPLQAGLLLLPPVGQLSGQPLIYSLIAGCAYQCAWVPAVWWLWAAAGLPRRRAGLALLLAVLTGFALVNTVFTWPKMLAAGLVVFAVTFALFGQKPGRPFPLLNVALLGLSAASGSLAHGGVAFTLLPLAVLLLLPRYNPGLSRLAAGAAVYLATMAPWSLYQALYDPPGTRLVLHHLAGRGTKERDDRPALRSILDAYGEIGFGQVVANKVANLKVLFRADARPPEELYPWPHNHDATQWPEDAVGFRRCEFLCLFWAPGLLNLGWVVALVYARRSPPALNPTLGVTVLALCLASVAAWVVLMFGPGSTVIHQGSYATFLLLFAALAAWLTSLPARWAATLVVLQGTIFAAGWLLTSPANDYGLPNVFMIPLGVGFFAALASTALGPSPRAKATAATEETFRPRRLVGRKGL